MCFLRFNINQMLYFSKLIHDPKQHWIIFKTRSLLYPSISKNEKSIRYPNTIQSNSADTLSSSMLYYKWESFDITPFRSKQILSGSAVLEHFLNSSNYFVKIFL